MWRRGDTSPREVEGCYEGCPRTEETGRSCDVSFPMQTANGEIVFAVGKDFTVTADQMLELLDRGELHAEGVRRLAQAQASATLMRSFLARYGKTSWQVIETSSKQFLKLPTATNELS